MRLSHNLASLDIFKEQSKVLQKQNAALGRISSGYKVNKAKDNPNVIAQSERLRMQIRGTQMAGKNVQDGVSMLQTAEGALGSVNDMLIRIRELAVQAGNGTNTDDDKKVIQNEIDEMLKGIDTTANNSEFNGVKLLADDKISKGEKDTNNIPYSNENPYMKSMPSGANVGESINIPMYNITTSKLFTDKPDVTGINGTDKALESIDKAIDSVLSITSKYGALENRFESGYSNLNELGDKMEASESSIRDADIAEEMMEFAKSNILVEAGTAMMVQTNKFPQDILRILENVRG